jgi:hypothetical protein
MLTGIRGRRQHQTFRQRTKWRKSVATRTIVGLAGCETSAGDAQKLETGWWATDGGATGGGETGGGATGGGATGRGATGDGPMGGGATGDGPMGGGTIEQAF